MLPPPPRSTLFPYTTLFRSLNYSGTAQFGQVPTNLIIPADIVIGGVTVAPAGTPVDALLRGLGRSEEHTSELQSRLHLVCRLLLEKKKKYRDIIRIRT